MQTSSTNPLLQATVENELHAVAVDMERLLGALHGRKPTGAHLARAKALRQRFQVLVRTQRGLESEQMALSVAYRERTGRNPGEDDAFTESDLQRAGEILAIFGLRVSER